MRVGGEFELWERRIRQVNCIGLSFPCFTNLPVLWGNLSPNIDTEWGKTMAFKECGIKWVDKDIQFPTE